MNEPTNAVLKGQLKALSGKMVKPDGSAPVKADYVMGRDFSTFAFLLKADDDTGATFTIVDYGHNLALTKADVEELGFTNVRDIIQYPSIGNA